MDFDLDSKLSEKELKQIGDLTTGLYKDGNLELAQTLSKMIKYYLRFARRNMDLEDILNIPDFQLKSRITSNIDDQLLTSGQVAKKFAVSNQTVLNWIENGKIKASQTPGGHWRIPASQFKTTKGQDKELNSFLERMWDKHKDLPPITDDDLEGI